MSVRLMSAVFASTIGPATKRLTMLALADAANDEGVCWPSMATIAGNAGGSVSAVREAAASLEKDGLIRRLPRINASNVYQIDVERLLSLPNWRAERGVKRSKERRIDPSEIDASSSSTPPESGPPIDPAPPESGPPVDLDPTPPGSGAPPPRDLAATPPGSGAKPLGEPPAEPSTESSLSPRSACGEGASENPPTETAQTATADFPAVVDVATGQTALYAVQSEPKGTPTAYTEAFDAAWLAYGRKGTKRAAFEEWRKAVKRAPADVITAAIGPYVESTQVTRWRKDFERWLKNDGWESALVPTGRVVNDSYQPYQNPTDQSVYDEPF